MKLNNKGYSIVEMFAVILITSLIIFPLLTTLVNNIEINDREQKRLAASNIAGSTLDSLNRFAFTDVAGLVTAANTNGDYYIEINFDTCNQLGAEDEALCLQLFSSIWNNVSFNSSEFRVFIMNYNLPQNYKDSLALDGAIPSAVKSVIEDYPANSATNPELYRVIVWIEYDTEENRIITSKGLLSNE